MVYCKKCGTQLNEGVNFCPKCGTPCDDNLVNTTNDTENSESFEPEQGETKGKFKKYLVYIFGVILLLCVIGYFSFKENMYQNELQEITNDNSVIADYDENKVYPGEYVFDAVMTDAALSKVETTYTMKIDGNKVSMSDGEMTFQGDIDNELKIEVGYDPNDGLHAYSITLRPNDREGKEWKGEWQSNAMFYNITLSLKECKDKGKPVKISQERKVVEETEEVAEEVDNSENEKIEEFKEKVMEYGNQIQQIMTEINNVYNQYVAASSGLDDMSKQSMGVNAVADISDLTLKGDRLFREMINLARQYGQQEALDMFKQEMDNFDMQAHQMERAITQDIYN